MTAIQQELNWSKSGKPLCPTMLDGGKFKPHPQDCDVGDWCKFPHDNHSYPASVREYPEKSLPSDSLEMAVELSAAANKKMLYFKRILVRRVEDRKPIDSLWIRVIAF